MKGSKTNAAKPRTVGGTKLIAEKQKRSKGNQYLGHHDDMCGLYCPIKSYELLPKTSWQKQQTSSNMGRPPEQRYPWKTSGLMSRHPQAPNQQFNGLLFLLSLLNKQKQIHDSDAVLVAPAASPPNKMHITPHHTHHVHGPYDVLRSSVQLVLFNKPTNHMQHVYK